jgi:hypothetical protein
MKAAESVFMHQTTGSAEDIDIHFQDVYPLYGQFDIRGSSDARHASIQADVKEQLELAAEVLDHAMLYHNLPIYQQLDFKMDTFREALGHVMHSSDEVRIFEFMRRELDPVFQYLDTLPEMKDLVRKYRSALDPKLGVVYKQRKDYEQSLTQINQRISTYIDEQQLIAQGMFPHYFDKFKTDGVEYNAFIGQSLVPSSAFHPLLLKNLRLWQMLVTCGVENRHQSYKEDLPMPLDITSLIMVHSNPIAIRFRLDERRFDVDGAYNVRYEILKKRIDKAHIKGTNERITQPGRLSIVYSQDWEADEYMEYITYLQSIGYLDSNLERLELEDLAGATGLMAFRVGFKYEVSPEMLIREMMQEVGG